MSNNVVVSPHYLSTKAGERVLELGGNAIDASIAMNAVQGVVAPETCGIGGDLFALIWISGEEQPYCLDSSGYAGTNVLEADFTSYKSIPLDHEATVTVPGAVKGWEAMHNKFSKLDFKVLLEQAIEIAFQGFEVSEELYNTISKHQSVLESQLSSSNFYSHGKPILKGSKLKRGLLGETLSSIALNGADTIYRGDIAKEIVDSTKGLLTLEDLSSFESKWINPIGIDIYERTGWTTPPHTQGYLTLATLKAYEMIMDSKADFDMHILIECYRSLASDRDNITYDYGENIDEFVGLNIDYILRKTEQIDPKMSSMFTSPKQNGGGTAYMAVKDSEGNAVSLIQSNFHGIGSTIGAGDYGFFLHNRGAGFNLIEDHPNKIAPLKQPLHTLSPTIWSKNGKLDMVIGTRGGRHQPQLLAQFILPLLLNEKSAEEVMNESRWTIDYFKEDTESKLIIEPNVDDEVLANLDQKGHIIEIKDSMQSSFGPISAIYQKEDGSWLGVADPRVETSKASNP